MKMFEKHLLNILQKDMNQLYCLLFHVINNFLISFKNLFKSLFRLIVVDFMKNLISRDRKCVANDPTKTMLLNVFK